MSKLDPRIEAVRKEYDLSADDFWQIPQNKQWVCKHAALEIVATKANVQWGPPQIIEADTANGIAAMAVGGTMGTRTEWATGEASPKNNKNAYPWAMAEKRAKDRVVLKLVGIHGLVYSEDEADDFKAPPVQQQEAQPSKYLDYFDAINGASTLDALQSAFLAAKADKSLTRQEADDLITAKDRRKAFLTKPEVPPDFDNLPPPTREAVRNLSA